MPEDEVDVQAELTKPAPWHRQYPVPEEVTAQLKTARARWEPVRDRSGPEADAAEAELAQFIAQLRRKNYTQTAIETAFGGRLPRGLPTTVDPQFSHQIPWSRTFTDDERLTDEEIEALRDLYARASRRGYVRGDKERAAAKAAAWETFRRHLVAAILRQVKPQTMAEQLAIVGKKTMSNHCSAAWTEYLYEGAPEGLPAHPSSMPAPVGVGASAGAGHVRSQEGWPQRRTGVIPVEQSAVHDFAYEHPGGLVQVTKGEARLQAAFMSTVRSGPVRRLAVATGYKCGYTDIYLPDESELIEVKGEATHRHVREALAQLLDYSAFALEPITRLSALFPREPASIEVSLLHRFGIDVLYRCGSEFPRLPAPERNRIVILGLRAAGNDEPDRHE